MGYIPKSPREVGEELLKMNNEVATAPEEPIDLDKEFHDKDLAADDLKNEAVEQTEGDIEGDEGIERIKRHESGEPDEKDIDEEEGLLPDDDEDAGKEDDLRPNQEELEANL